ncbi:MAG: prolyl oligopeptidase family serine peptidase, partial [Balneolaceae bacterium]|nr:prolyl oligopeptidase family serine peptidase [Balneolaceae bacterium]
MTPKQRLPLILFIFLLAFNQYASAQGLFTFEDVMKFEDIKSPVISADGRWIAYGVWPEVGDGEVRIQSIDGSRMHIIERGQNPQITHNGSWAGALVQPPTLSQDEDAQTSLVLLNTANGDTIQFSAVRSFEFSENGEWAMIHHPRTEELDDFARNNRRLGYPVTLHHLDSNRSRELPFVHESAADSTYQYFAYSIVDTSGVANSLWVIDLSQSADNEVQLLQNNHQLYSNLTWDHDQHRLAFTSAAMDTAKSYTPGDATIMTADAASGEINQLIQPDQIESGYRLRADNRLMWTNDGNRLFFGVQDAAMVKIEETEAPDDSLTAENLYDIDRILQETESDVWHWDDPLIKTHEKQTWNQRSSHLYTAVYHFDRDEIVHLATKEMPFIQTAHHTGKILGYSDIPYLKLRTWDGTYRDVYLVDLRTGEKERILTQHPFSAQLSPSGRYTVWFDGTDWHLTDNRSDMHRNLTSDLTVPFAEEDNDRPRASDSYGIAGWTDRDRSVLIYDKYDIWQFDTESGEAMSITGGTGREEQRIFRIYDTNPDKETFGRNERLLLTMYHDHNKNYGFYEARTGRNGVSKLLEDQKRYEILEKAEESNTLLFTRESYTEYPNLWVSGNLSFRNPRQVTNLHSDLTEKYAWGHAELVEWLNVDGRPVQGVLIYPGNYEPGKRYPVFIYYYERFSQRLHEFNRPVTNHRPNFAQYTSDGYAVFLPDIWFDVPVPGYSATKNLVPGVQKLVEMGVADPDAIGLHGHSWSGYLTAHVITQTDIFAAAVAGAPVGNMTSAYSGIRWGSGLARQFQYEKTQSRLGVSMWENLAPFIENSPVFYADRINTPILIQH